MKKEEIESFQKIDYEALLDIVINNLDYDDLQTVQGEGELTTIPGAKDMEERLLAKIERLKQQGVDITTYDQYGAFNHISINRDFHVPNQPNQLRLYLSPKQEHLVNIAVELIRRSVEEGRSTYFKYSRKPTIDKIVFYITSEEDLKDKLELIEECRRSYPQIFEGMKRCPYWINETPIEGVYVAPENIIVRFTGDPFFSYGLLMETALEEIKTLLYYELREQRNPNTKPLLGYNRNYLMQLFIPLCRRTFGKYGCLIYYQDGDIHLHKNKHFPGVGEELTEEFKITSDRSTLEVSRKEPNGLIRTAFLPMYGNEYVTPDTAKFILETPEEYYNRGLYPEYSSRFGQK